MSFTHKMAAKTSWHIYMERNYITVTLCIATGGMWGGFFVRIDDHYYYYYYYFFSPPAQSIYAQAQGIYIAQVRKGHKCAKTAKSIRMSFGGRNEWPQD